MASYNHAKRNEAEHVLHCRMQLAQYKQSRYDFPHNSIQLHDAHIHTLNE